MKIEADLREATPAQSLAAVCSLPPAGRKERIAWIRREIQPHTRSIDAVPGGVCITFEPVRGLDETLEAWVEAERACCGGLDWHLVAGPDPGTRSVEIGGLDVDAEILSVFRPVLGTTEPTRRTIGRAALAGVASMGIACAVVPLAALAGLGGAARALDAPWPLMGLGAGTAFLSWFWLRRHRKA